MKKKIIIISILIITLICLIIAFVNFAREYLYVNTTYKLKQYADSTYTNSIDSITLHFSDNIEEPDSVINSIPDFKDGFYSFEMNTTYYDVFRRSRYKNNDYYTGEYKNRKKVGRWKHYSWIESEYPFEERNYNSNGELHGTIISYNTENGQPRMIDNFRNGEWYGIQKAYHSNRQLSYQYELDSVGYINEFMSFSENGDTLYYIDLTAEGTGYVKKHGEWGTLEWEGTLKNKKREGYHIYYTYDGVDQYEQIDYRNLYQSDSLIKRIYYPRANQKFEYNADSNIWYPESRINEYWKGGKIIKTEKE